MPIVCSKQTIQNVVKSNRNRFKSNFKGFNFLCHRNFIGKNTSFLQGQMDLGFCLRLYLMVKRVFLLSLFSIYRFNQNKPSGV